MRVRLNMDQYLHYQDIFFFEAEKKGKTLSNWRNMRKGKMKIIAATTSPSFSKNPGIKLVNPR